MSIFAIFAATAPLIITTNILAKVHDSYPDKYSSIIEVENGYACQILHTNIPRGMQTAIRCDSALVRQCLCVLFNIDTDANMSRRNPLEDYLGKREKESEEGTSGAPSVKEFFQELAFWLFDKFYDKYKEDEDFKLRFDTVLGYLQDPAQLHKLWEGDDKFEYQGINCAKEELDIRQQFKCLHSLYDKSGRVRSTFGLNSGSDLFGLRKKEITAIDVISKAFKSDFDHHSSVGSPTWVDRENDFEEFMNWLKLQRDILCSQDQNNGAIRRFNRQVQLTIDKIHTEKEQAKTTHEQNDTLHPVVAYERECIAIDNSPPDYGMYMKDIIVSLFSSLFYCLTVYSHSNTIFISAISKGDDIKTIQNQYKQDIKILQSTPFYKSLLDAQTGDDCTSNSPTPLSVLETVFTREMNTNEWYQNKFNGLQWEGICSFTNDEYVNAGKHRPELIGGMYRYLLVRLAKECMMKGCSIKPSDYDIAKSLYAFHLHHINKGDSINGMLSSIGEMSEEAKKNCVVFCAGCHNFKEQDNVYSIPLNKLQNQLMYDEGDDHITGRELVLDFDLIVVVLKLFIVGGFRTVASTPDVLRSIFFDHFGILYDDTVDHDVDDTLTNLDDKVDCKQYINSAILGALKKRSKRCPGCKMGFMNISSFHSTIIHWDHTEDKEFKGAYLNRKQIVVMLNEIGRYLGATCAFCHGEQPMSCKGRRTWET